MCFSLITCHYFIFDFSIGHFFERVLSFLRERVFTCETSKNHPELVEG